MAEENGKYIICGLVAAAGLSALSTICNKVEGLVKPSAAYVADVNQDGIQDIVVFNRIGQKELLLGPEYKTFECFVDDYKAQMDSIEARMYQVE